MFLKTGDKELDEIPTYIVYSVVALIFCIFPGAVALYYSFRVIDDKKKATPLPPATTQAVPGSSSSSPTPSA